MAAVCKLFSGLFQVLSGLGNHLGKLARTGGIARPLSGRLLALSGLSERLGRLMSGAGCALSIPLRDLIRGRVHGLLRLFDGALRVLSLLAGFGKVERLRLQLLGGCCKLFRELRRLSGQLVLTGGLRRYALGRLFGQLLHALGEGVLLFGECPGTLCHFSGSRTGLLQGLAGIRGSLGRLLGALTGLRQLAGLHPASRFSGAAREAGRLLCRCRVRPLLLCGIECQFHRLPRELLVLLGHIGRVARRLRRRGSVGSARLGLASRIGLSLTSDPIL